MVLKDIWRCPISYEADLLQEETSQEQPGNRCFLLVLRGETGDLSQPFTRGTTEFSELEN